MIQPSQDAKTSARVFTNSLGSWKTAEKCVKDVMIQAQEVDDIAIMLVQAMKKLDAMVLEAFKNTPKTDCLFYDSPISANRQNMYLRAYLFKLGWSGIRDIFTDPTKIRQFSDEIKDGCRWLMKFKNENKELDNE